MKKIIILTTLALFLMTAASWAATGKFSGGGVVTIQSGTTLFGGQVKYGVMDKVDVEGRLELATVSGATVTLISGLGIYNFDVGIKQVVPYAGGGISIMSATVAVPGFGSFGGSATGLTVLGGASYLITEQAAAFAEAAFSTTGGTGGLGISLGGNYTF
ncbi:MAG: hypothetical protein KJ732_07065 [Candidatus Margulisbacteria bacterium]|nr:hypothetical protein [Candidatus Margulisiibacteriota bacterium]